MENKQKKKGISLLVPIYIFTILFVFFPIIYMFLSVLCHGQKYGALICSLPLQTIFAF